MSQANRIMEILKDGLPHSSFELVREAYEASGHSLARLGARIWDLKQRGTNIKSWRDVDNPKMWWYQIRRNEQIPAPSEPTPRPTQTSYISANIYDRTF